MEKLIQAKNLTITRQGKTVLEALSFDAEAGMHIGLIGANGAGKSTLLQSLAGHLSPTSGQASLSGGDIHRLSLKERAQKIGYLPQERPFHWPITVKEAVSLARLPHGFSFNLTEAENDEAIEAALKKTDIAALSDRSVQTLSGGEKARTHLARLLAGGAPILLADEPITALDPAHALAMLALLREEAKNGRLVISALHDLGLAARFCDRLLLLKDGRLIKDGTPKEILTPTLLEEAYLTPFTVHETKHGPLPIP